MQVSKLQTTLTVCGSPSSVPSPEEAAQKMTEQDVRIQQLEQEADRLRGQIAQGAQQYKQTMAGVRQQNADLQSEVS